MGMNGESHQTATQAIIALIVIQERSNNSTLKFINQLNAMTYNKQDIALGELFVHSHT